MTPAAGQKEKAQGEHSSGDLIITPEGIPLIVLGYPDARDEWDREEQAGIRGKSSAQLLRGTLVVLVPDLPHRRELRGGPIMLHVVDAHPSRPTFLSPWGRGWIPIPAPDP